MTSTTLFLGILWRKKLWIGKLKFFSLTIFRNVDCHLLTIRTSGNLATTYSSNALLLWKHNKIHIVYALQNLLENSTWQLIIMSLLCIGDLLNWRFCNLEIWRFSLFLETPALNATQKTTSLCLVPLLRKSRKTTEMTQKWAFWGKLAFLEVFLDFLSNCTGQRPVVWFFALRSVPKDAFFELSKLTFGKKNRLLI